jgi:hypothetical protein
MNIPWWGYVILAGLSWGCYVPLIFYGGTELGGKPNSRIMAILCVGVAYFFIAVLLPLGLFLSGREQWPELKTTGLVFAGLAGVAGALGAICVIFASKAAVAAAKLEGVDPSTYRLFIAPVLFALAPLINTLLSCVWDPQPGNPFNLEVVIPGWHLVLGVVLVGAGTFFVLYSKEESEEAKKKAHAKHTHAPPVAVAATPGPNGQP